MGEAGLFEVVSAAVAAAIESFTLHVHRGKVDMLTRRLDFQAEIVLVSARREIRYTTVADTSNFGLISAFHNCLL